MTATDPNLVPIGIEFEFRSPVQQEYHDCNCDYCDYEPDDESTSTWEIINNLGHPKGWEIGDDHEWVEIRSLPTPLGEADDLVRELREWIRRYERSYGDIDIDSNCSFHVHVNCTSFESEQQLDPKSLLQSYVAHRETFVDLCSNSYRPNAGWCSPIYDWDTLPIPSNCGTFENGSEVRDQLQAFGTLEFRLLDATDDLDLMLKRVEAVRTMVGHAIALSE